MTVLQAVDEGLTGMAPLLRTLVGERNLVIRTGATDAHIRLAAAEFESIMAKLVQNAVDATPVNGEITIETARLNPEDPSQQRMLEEYGLAMTTHIRIRLEDNGRGIPAEHRKSVFKPFFTTRPGSLGLGLSAVHGIVKRAAGTVTFESEIGKGATFDVLVPESTCNANS
jgi:two-component system cell cycle sensor histidine kinase/response regulator CckA